jgi:hypothetical protein
MKISWHEAFDLLAKWQQEKRTITCVFTVVTRDIGKIMGKIVSISKSAVQINSNSVFDLIQDYSAFIDVPIDERDTTYEFAEPSEGSEVADRYSPFSETVPESQMTIGLPGKGLTFRLIAGEI